jgi:hypothetical protein
MEEMKNLRHYLIGPPIITKAVINKMTMMLYTEGERHTFFHFTYTLAVSFYFDCRVSHAGEAFRFEDKAQLQLTIEIDTKCSHQR